MAIHAKIYPSRCFIVNLTEDSLVWLGLFVMSRLSFFWIDNAAMLIFSTISGFAIETLIAGMTVQQSLHARLAAIPLNLATGRPYGIYRDYCLARYEPESRVSVFLIESLIFTSFQIPLYFLVLSLAGVSFEQMLAASLAKISLFGGLGRVYGIFLDYFRGFFLSKKSFYNLKFKPLNWSDNS